MLEFRQRQKRRKLLYSNLTIVALCIVIGIAAKQAWNIYGKERHAQELLASARIREQNLVERESFLKSELAQLDTTAGVEGELRERYGVAKPGEKVIMLVDVEATTAPPETERGWWTALWSWFE